MTVCANEDWDMFLRKDGSTQEEPIAFREVSIVDQIIKGVVIKDGKTTPLSGRCSPSNHPDESFMRFDFKVTASDGMSVVKVFLGGVGRQPSAPGLKPEFKGVYWVSQALTGFISELGIRVDPGDTGTGNGTQT